MNISFKKIGIKSARDIALVGIMAATLSCGKLALSFLPNIEVVTLLTALYGYVFGWLGVASAIIFVCIEPLIYGFGSWIITYIIYWPALAALFMILGRKGVKGRLALTASAVGMTVAFGLLSSFIDSALYLGINKHFLVNFFIFYARGIIFYLVQIACNAALFPTVFPYLADKISVICSKTETKSE